MTTHSPDDFLSHAAYLRGLVASIVGREDLAEDILQDVWVAALATPPRKSWDPRRWLGGVARNLTRQHRREGGRRARRERAAARPEGIPGPDETVQRLELLRTVVDAVEGLAEPSRQVVMLRFFDALPPREIARRLGVPVETVRTRLRRAREALRERLDRSHGDRSAWSACLLPFALCGPREAVSVAVPAALQVAGAAVVMAGVFFGLATSLDAPGAGAVARPLTTTVVATETVAESVHVEPASVARRPLVAAEEWRVHGRVTRFGNGAYAGARITIRRYAGFDAVGQPAFEARVVADAKGAFAWSSPRPTAPTRVVLECGVRSREHRASRDVLWVPGDPDPQALRLHCDPLDCEIAGRVVDATGQPLVGATVGVFRRTTKTDKTGRYRIRASTRLGKFVRVYARRHVLQQRTLELNRGEQHVQDWRMERGATVVGRVTDAAGAPVAGVRFWQYWDALKQEGETDADGRYELTCLDPAQPVRLTANHDGFVSATRRVALSGERTTQDFVLPRGAELAGTVVDRAGRPVLAATLRLYPGGDLNGSAERRCLSREAGRFRLVGAQPGEKTLVVTRRGFGPVQIPVTLPRPEPLTVALPDGHVLAGVVRDDDGRPVAGATLRVFGGRNRWSGPALGAAVRSDAEGRFRLVDLPGRTLTVAAGRRGYLDAEALVEGASGAQVDLVLRRAGGLAGTVIDARTRQPVQNFRVRFVRPVLEGGEQEGSGYNANWSSAGRMFQDFDGHWTTGAEALEVGTVFGIEIHAAGYATAIVPRAVVAAEPDPKDLVVRLRRGSPLAGRIVAAGTGAPVVGARVRILTPDEDLRREAPTVERGTRAITDARGAFTFAQVPGGALRIFVEHADWPVHLDGPFEGRAARLIELQPGGVVSGRVLDATNAPVPGAPLELSPQDGFSAATSRRFTADAAGRFRFDLVPAGLYELTRSVQRGNHGIVTQRYRVRVRPRGRVEIRMGRPGQGYAIRGVLTSAGALPKDVYVGLIPKNRNPVEGVADVQRLPGWVAFATGGRFELLGVPPGEYTIYASRLGAGPRVQGALRARVQDQDLEVEVPVSVGK